MLHFPVAMRKRDLHFVCNSHYGDRRHNMNIGFLDYQLTNSHYKKFHSLLIGAVGGGEVKIIAADEMESTDQGRQWCKDNNVRYCETAQEVVDASDAVIVLAPNNFEKHLEVAGPALASGKPVFIDKLLAHTPDHAKSIVDAAAKAKTPIMSSSSLRFAVELDELNQRVKGKPEGVFARGYGKFAIYAVHTVAMALRYYGSDVKRVIDTGAGPVRHVTLDGPSGRATVEVRDSANGAKANPWQLGVITDGKYEIATVTNNDGFYENLMRKTLEFFRTGKSPLSNDEMLTAVRVIWAAEESFDKGGVWVDV
jgi:hypothetical protein